MNKKAIEELDITGKIGPLYTDSNSEWPMYSYSRPAYIFWNGFAKGLARRGLSLNQIKDELQSKGPRWLLDQYSEKLEACGEDLAMDYELCVTKER